MDRLYDNFNWSFLLFNFILSHDSFQIGKSAIIMPVFPTKANVVIVGGGIIGVSIAYHLARQGISDVLLLERRSLGSGSTGKCVGGIRIQFSTPIHVAFSALSLKTFEAFEREIGVDPDFRRIGYLFLALRREQNAFLGTMARNLQARGYPVAFLSQSEIRARWPFLNTADVVGGSFSPQDGYASPNDVLQGFARKARQLGVSILEGAEVAAIDTCKGRIRGVRTTSAQRIDAPIVINAAGPWASEVARMVGLDLPVRPVRRQIFFTPSFSALPRRLPLVIDLGNGWYMRREGPGLLLAGPQDTQPSYREYTDFEGMEWASERSLYRVPALERTRIAGGWAGLYEISPDNHAVIGGFPELEGFVCACGFSGHGFQHSPAAGMLVAELVSAGKTQTLDIHPLRPTRFREGALVRESLTAFRD
jgi:sarcosine oxidase subunit beta